MQDPTIDYSLQRLSKMIPKHADDPDRLSKVRRTKFSIIKDLIIFLSNLGNNS
jgi:hypothetical protein